jgi:putative flippase GtrA
MFAKFFVATGISVIVIQNIVIYLVKPLYSNLAAHFLHSSLDTRVSLNLAKITAVLVGMVWNFVLYSRVIFANKHKTGDEEEIQNSTSIV